MSNEYRIAKGCFHSSRAIHSVRRDGSGFTQGIRMVFFGLICLVTQPVFAQLIEMPIRRFEDYPSSAPKASAARITQTLLTLPFFDDFSGEAQRHSSFPDTARWMPGSGVNINNGLPINHPTLNVATFDGLKGNGAPYDFSSPLAQGLTDSLVSQPIDLSSYNPADALYLSFFWEARGLGEQPDLSDSLVLQFKDNAGNWQVAWSQPGQVKKNGQTENVTNTQFTQAFKPLLSPAFFHNNFQFQFRAFGRQSGAFDVWHLDYVYLEQHRNNGRYTTTQKPEPGKDSTGVYPKDVAFRGPVSSFLKRYTAMPVDQYFFNPTQETADSIKTVANNLEDTNPTFTTLTVWIEDTLSVGKPVFQSCGIPSPACATNLEDETLNPRSSKVRKFTPSPPSKPTDIKPMVLKTTFKFEKTADYLPEVDLAVNNSISGYTVLDNYYAYDDGTAEYSGGINQRLGRVAVQYILNSDQAGKFQPDTLRAIQLYITQFNASLAGQGLVLQVFGNKNGKPDGNPLYTQSYSITYPNSNNKFQEFAFFQVKITNKVDTIPVSIAVKDTFYVGWQQITDVVMPVGLDKNTNSRNKIFFNLGAGAWNSNLEQITPVEGSFMIRPVMGTGTPPIITGTDEPNPSAPPFDVYPNPTDGRLTWNDATFTFAKVYDLTGRLLLSRQLKGQDDPQLDLGFLSNGLYLLHLSNGKRMVVRKVVVAK